MGSIPLMQNRIPRPEHWLPYLEKSYEKAQFSNGGPCAENLEKGLQEYLSLKATPVLMSNATIALTMALRALGLKGKVLLPSFTFYATYLSVVYAGLEPILVDVEEDLGFSLRDAERKLDKGTSAMVVVQPLGMTVSPEKYEKFAAKHGLKLIFDSAAALGARYDDGQLVGARGDCEVFSLHVTKTFGVGEGALVTSQNHELMQRCRQLINFGLGADRKMGDLGYNAKMSELHAAVGLSVLQIIGARLERRELLHQRYCELIAAKKLPIKTFRRHQAYQVFSILAESAEQKQSIVKVFDAKKIQWRTYYEPLHQQPLLSADAVDYPQAQSIWSRIISIPFFEEITEEQQQSVVEAIAEGCAQQSRVISL